MAAILERSSSCPWVAFIQTSVPRHGGGLTGILLVELLFPTLKHLRDHMVTVGGGLSSFGVG